MEKTIEQYDRNDGVMLQLPLGDAADTFDIEEAVCSHGLFMMAPNHWDPLSKSLIRSLRLHPDDDDCSASVMVRINQPKPKEDHSHLRVQVYGGRSLSPQHELALLDQVRRMLRLSEREEMNVREFRKMGFNGGGRVFRSPTLFEDMVKCILLCNCQWPRTLSMAKALCMLQFELQNHSQKQDFVPNTPEPKESKKRKNQNPNFADPETETRMTDNLLTLQNSTHICKFCKIENELDKDDSHFPCQLHTIGNFPSPEELADVDEGFLAKRCNLGYRASRILKLAKGIVEGKVQLKVLEEICKGDGLSSYEFLHNQLKEIDGFGPFTCANVLMCMGFYHVIPTDSETIRHLKQVHARKSTIRTVERDIEDIYGKFAPFQFLAYWSELWDFYEKKFGKLSEMACRDYKLITASKMRSN